MLHRERLVWPCRSFAHSAAYIYPCVDLRSTHLCRPTTRLEPRARAHSFKHKLCSPCVGSARSAPPRYHIRQAPRNERPAPYRYPAGLHKQTRYRRARATSKHGCRPVTLGGLVPLYLSPQLHHQAQRRTIARRYSHIELRPCPRNADAWVGQPSGDLPRTAV